MRFLTPHISLNSVYHRAICSGASWYCELVLLSLYSYYFLPRWRKCMRHLWQKVITDYSVNNVIILMSYVDEFLYIGSSVTCRFVMHSFFFIVLFHTIFYSFETITISLFKYTSIFCTYSTYPSHLCHLLIAQLVISTDGLISIQRIIRRYKSSCAIMNSNLLEYANKEL